MRSVKPSSSKKHSFAPRQEASTNKADRVIKVERQRRSLKNIILAAIMIASSAIMATLLITPKEDIKVQVNAEKTEFQNQSGLLEIKGLSFKGITDDGHDFIVLAEGATESASAPDLVQLNAPRARVSTPFGEPMTLRAQEGAFHRKEERVELNGRVVIVRPDLGYTLMTEAMVAYLDSGLMTSDTAVRGFSPQAQVQSDGIIISESGEKIVFTGKSVLQIAAE